MKKPVDQYDSHYDQVEMAVYGAVRLEPYGEDLGQASWLTAAECDTFCRWLDLKRDQKVLEVACGSGGVALRMVERLGVSAVGVDVNEFAVKAAASRATVRGVQDRVAFRTADAN